MLVVPKEITDMLTGRLEDFLKTLAQEHLPFGKTLQMDGVVCLTNSTDTSQEVVLKLHKNNTPSQPAISHLRYREPIQVPYVVNYTNNASNDVPQDLRVRDPPTVAHIAQGQSVLNHTVRIAGPRPQALQLVKPMNFATSLLYKKITEGASKQAAPEPVEPQRQEEKPEEEEEDPALATVETICPDCSQTVYGGFPAFEKHVRNVHSKWACKHCNKLFTQRCNMKRHENLHLSQKPFPCHICKRAFSRSSDLKTHMQKHADDVLSHENQANALRDAASPATCPKCELIFDTEETLRWHMYKQHRSQDDKWVCTICEQVFLNEETYEEHRLTHKASLNQYKQAPINISEDENTNDDQVMRDEYQRDLVIDERTTTSQDDSSNEAQPSEYPSIKRALETTPVTSSRKRRKGKPIRHVQQNAEFSDEDNEHIEYGPLEVETVNPASAQSPSQSVCSENDPLMNSYNSDVVASSSMNHCNRVGDFELPTPHPLENLQSLAQAPSPLIIRPDSNTSFPGDYVSSPSCQSPALSHHSANNSLLETSANTPQNAPTPLDPIFETKDYTCSLEGCTMMFMGFKAFEEHTTTVHKRHPCHMCKQTFSGKNNRTRHTRNHDKVKLYPCPDCQKKFSRPDSMREHRFTHTLSYKEDRCRRCGEEFDKKSKLLAHLKSCFRQHRTKNGSIDESLFEPGPMSVNGNLDEAPSGLVLAGIKLENNNEPLRPFLVNGNHPIPQEAAQIAASITQALANAPPKAHTHSENSQLESAQDLSGNGPDSPLDLARSTPESPMDLANKTPELAPVTTPTKAAHGSPRTSSDQGSPGSELSLSDMAGNNNTGEKPMDLAAAIETPRDKVRENGVVSIPVLATTLVETPQVGVV